MCKYPSLVGGMVAGVGVLLLCSAAAGDELISLSAADVSTSYTYPNGIDGGEMLLQDMGVGAIATRTGGDDVFSAITLTMSLPFIAELGDPNDALAYGLFGGGSISFVDTSGISDETIFEATVDEFEFAEDPGNIGLFVGVGTFSGAAYGGDLSGVTLPTSGQIFTDLFSWYTDVAKTIQMNIDNFDDIQNLTVYGDMNLNVVPEPATLVLLATACLWPLRNRFRS